MNLRKIIEKIQHYSPISIGMRTFKTWIATTLTAAIALTPIIGNPFYALMGTIFGMQNTVANSFKMGKGRIVGTAVGAFIGFLFAYFELSSPPIIGLAVVIAIIICGLLKINHSIFITVTLCLLIMFNPNREGGLLNYTFFRTLDTASGVIIGFLVNRFIAPPNHLKNLTSELESLYELTKESLKDDSKLPSLKKLLSKLSIIHTNYQADEKYDNYDLSNENLCKTVDACGDLYFHFKSCTVPESIIENYHANKINETLILLENTISALKGVI